MTNPQDARREASDQLIRAGAETASAALLLFVGFITTIFTIAATILFVVLCFAFPVGIPIVGGFALVLWWIAGWESREEARKQQEAINREYERLSRQHHIPAPRTSLD